MIFFEGMIAGALLLMLANRADQWRFSPRCPACNQVAYSGVCKPCLDNAAVLLSREASKP